MQSTIHWWSVNCFQTVQTELWLCPILQSSQSRHSKADADLTLLVTEQRRNQNTLPLCLVIVLIGYFWWYALRSCWNRYCFEGSYAMGYMYLTRFTYTIAFKSDSIHTLLTWLSSVKGTILIKLNMNIGEWDFSTPRTIGSTHFGQMDLLTSLAWTKGSSKQWQRGSSYTLWPSLVITYTSSLPVFNPTSGIGYFLVFF